MSVQFSSLLLRPRATLSKFAPYHFKQLIEKKIGTSPSQTARNYGQLIRDILQFSQEIRIKQLQQNKSFQQIKYQISGWQQYFPICYKSLTKCFYTGKIQKDSYQCFIQRFQKALKKARQNPDKYYLCYQLETGYIEIDILLIQYNSHDQLFDMITFSVAFEEMNIQKKLRFNTGYLSVLLLDVASTNGNKYLKEYIAYRQSDNDFQFRMSPDIRQGDKNTYRIHHIMICPKKYCKPAQEIAPNLLMLSYCSVEDISFADKPENAKNLILLKYSLQEIQRKNW